MSALVGSRLYPGRSLPEGVAAVGGRGWLLVISVDHPTREEIATVGAGAIDLAIDREGPALIWFVRALPERQRRRLPARRGMMRPRAPKQVLAWSAAAWPWWERHEAPGEVDVAQVVLVHSRTTQVHAVRTIGLPDRIAERIYELEADAIAEGRDEIAWDRVLRWTQRASNAALEERATKAPARTGVEEKAS